MNNYSTTAPREVVTLKNGATLIRQKDDTNDPGSSIVLARLGNEYVTWRMWADGTTIWGHYYQTLEAGVADFEARG